MEWKKVTIEVSNTGEARFLDRPLTIYTKAGSGYQRIQIALHRAVAVAFHGPPPNDGQKYVVDHIDNNPRNNKAENLQWLTPIENTQKHFRGTPKKLTPDQIQTIASLAPKDATTLTSLAKQFGVSLATVKAIRTGRNHKNGYSALPQTKLSQEQFDLIKAWRPHSPTAAQLGRLMAVSNTTIENIWHGRYGVFQRDDD